MIRICGKLSRAVSIFPLNELINWTREISSFSSTCKSTCCYVPRTAKGCERQWWISKKISISRSDVSARSSARSIPNDAIKQQLIDGELRRDAQRYLRDKLRYSRVVISINNLKIPNLIIHNWLYPENRAIIVLKKQTKRRKLYSPRNIE